MKSFLTFLFISFSLFCNAQTDSSKHQYPPRPYNPDWNNPIKEYDIFYVFVHDKNDSLKIVEVYLSNVIAKPLGTIIDSRVSASFFKNDFDSTKYSAKDYKIDIYPSISYKTLEEAEKMLSDEKISLKKLDRYKYATFRYFNYECCK